MAQKQADKYIYTVKLRLRTKFASWQVYRNYTLQNYDSEQTLETDKYILNIHCKEITILNKVYRLQVYCKYTLLKNYSLEQGLQADKYIVHIHCKITTQNNVCILLKYIVNIHCKTMAQNKVYRLISIL